MSNTKTREIKTKFSIEGERNLKVALKENAAQAKELKSEMALLDAKFADATDSEEYLAEKSELLARQTANAQEKVDLYNGALENARECQQQLAQQVEQSRQSLQEQEDALEAARAQYGDGSDQVAKLTDELEYNRRAVENQEAQLSKANKAVLDYRTSANYAQASVEQMSAAVQENDKALEEAAQTTDGTSKSMCSFGSAITDLIDKVGVKLPGGAKEAISAMGSFSEGVSGSASGILAGASLIYTAMQEIVKITKEAAEAADDILTISKQYGISTDMVQLFEGIENLADVSMDTLLDAYKKTVEAQGKVIEGNEDMISVMRRLGLSIYDTSGKLKDTDVLMFEMFDKLGRIHDETERNVLMQKIYGDNFTKLNSIVADGGKAFNDAVEYVKNSNYIIGEEGVKALGRYSDEQEKMRLKLESYKRSVAVMNADISADTRVVERAILDLLIPSINNASDAAINAGKSAGSWLDTIKNALAETMKIPDLSIYGKVLKGNASGTPYFEGGQTRVGEYGPEVVTLPRGSSVMNARDTASAAAGTTNITLNVSVPNLETLNRIVQFYENYQITKRMG